MPPDTPWPRAPRGGWIEWPDDAGPEYVRRYPHGFRVVGRCRSCGCTAQWACRDGGQGCCWVNARLTLCSRCAARPGRRRFRRRRLGREAVAAIRAWWAQRQAQAADLEAAYHRAYAADHGTHRHFEVEVDGQQMRIFGDPHMDEATLRALVIAGQAMAAAAKRAVAQGERP